MKIKVETNPTINETEVHIICEEVTNNVEKIISVLNAMNQKLIVKKKGETVLLEYNSVLYLDTVDKKIFVYTKDDIYETVMRLYEVEEREEFLRISKSCVINLMEVQSLKSEFDRKIRVTMSNQEELIASRQYAAELKKRLGVK